MQFKIWLENQIVPLSTLTKQQVIDIQNAADLQGKHKKILNHYDFLKNDIYYLIDAPLNLLDFDSYIEGNPVELSPDQEKRVQQYMLLQTEAPPVLLRYSEKAKRRGNPYATVVNGNHRCAVAMKQNRNIIKAIISRSDFELWNQ